MKLFISYAHTDNWQVTQIVELLRSGGHDPWFDQRLLPGQDWKKELRDAVDSCEIFVFALSPASSESEWCQWEFTQAVELKKPIVPILILATEKVPESLVDRQFVDFSQGMTPEAVARLMGGITHIAVTIPGDAVKKVMPSDNTRPAQAEDFQKHVFISYNRKDQEMMKRVRDSFQVARIPIWSDDSLNSGAEYQQEMVQKAIVSAGCMIVILSLETKTSSPVRTELDTAVKHNIPIIPLVAQSEWKDVMLPQLADLTPVDLTTDFATSIRKVVDMVQKYTTSDTERPTKPVRLAAPVTGFWDILIRVIQKERCIPFIGASLDQEVMLSRQEIAVEWAKKHSYPFAAGYDRDLARVAHFMTVEMGGPFISKDDIVESWLKGTSEPDFSKDDQLHSALASLGFPALVTTSYNDFLYRAMEYHSKVPQRVFFFEDEWQSSYGQFSDDASVQKPMIFHLYGHYSEPESLILTEDDYLNYLVRITRQEIKFPSTITSAIGKNSYLFVGFTVTEWDLRILFHILSNLGRKGRGPHIAVQIEPIQDISSDEQEERVRAYLEGYFRDHLRAHVDVHVGSTKDFILELKQRWQQEQANA